MDGNESINVPAAFLFKQNLKLVCLGKTASFPHDYYSFKGMSIVGDLLSFK